MLNERELLDPVWLKIKAKYEQRLAELRKNNDRHALTELETATLRGRIAEVKMLLAAGEPKPEIEKD